MFLLCVNGNIEASENLPKCNKEEVDNNKSDKNELTEVYIGFKGNGKTVYINNI